MDTRELQRVEYRIKPVTRYIITKYEVWSHPDQPNETSFV